MQGLAKFFSVANYHRKSAITGAIDEAPWTERLSVGFEKGRQVDRQQEPLQRGLPPSLLPDPAMVPLVT